MKDKIIQRIIRQEIERQGSTVNLIASENIVSRDVLEALGSPLTNKYAEGYSKLRYYGGNEFIDEIEILCKKRALALFGLPEDAWHVNVQALSGSPANLAVYLALVPPGEKIMGLKLDMGGHLTHGHTVSATGKFWHSTPFVLDKKTELLDYSAIARAAKKEKPKIIVAGFTAYPRVIDWKKFKSIAESVGAYLLVDMSHIAGLVAGGAYPSPFPYADVVTTTTHKTLRGPRSALIFARKDLGKAIDKAVFPGLQGGPHANQIAAVAVALEEARRPAFKSYVRQILKNADMLSSELSSRGFRIVSGGTDTHLLLVDVSSKGLSGKSASDRLEASGIIVNKNTIPYDTRTPVDPSGIRLGPAALTTRGMKEREMKLIARWIVEVLLEDRSPESVRREVKALCRRFPLPY